MERDPVLVVHMNVRDVKYLLPAKPLQAFTVIRRLQITDVWGEAYLPPDVTAEKAGDFIRVRHRLGIDSGVTPPSQVHR